MGPYQDYAFGYDKTSPGEHYILLAVLGGGVLLLKKKK